MRERSRMYARTSAPALKATKDAVVVSPWTVAALLLLAAETVGGIGAFFLVGAAIWVVGAGPAARCQETGRPWRPQR
jgi:hypothetical protein